MTTHLRRELPTRFHDLGLDQRPVLPDLDSDTLGSDIVADNVKAIAALYFAAMLEEMKLYAVADKVAEQFMSGVLPLASGVEGSGLYTYAKNAPMRMSEIDRRSLYLRTLGIAGGSPADRAPSETVPNVAFSPALLAFAKALVTPPPDPASVLGAGRALAINASLHGYGMAHLAAIELHNLIDDILRVLGAPHVLAAYGVRDIWQLVERVSAVYLGGSVDGVRRRTLASAGAEMLVWIAEQARLLGQSASPAGLTGVVQSSDVIANAERWLAATGAPDGAAGRRDVIRIEVARLLEQSSAYRRIAPVDRARIAGDTVTIVEAMMDGPEAAVEGVDFPGFVAALVSGTFHAIVASSIEQMQAYADLVQSIAKSESDFATGADSGSSDRPHPPASKAARLHKPRLATVVAEGIARIRREG